MRESHFFSVPHLILMCFFTILGSLNAQEKTNVIVVLVDDQGYYDLGCYGATEVKTPNIDTLAKEGIRFTDYYAAAPICSPSRAGLLTGCYPRRIGMETWVQRADSEIGLHRDERTMAELFHAHGYRTACIGKWHLGDFEGFRPLQQGFDYYYGLLHNLDPVETVYFEKEGGVPIMRNNEVVKRPADPAELTRLYTDEAIDFIKKNKEDPFFIYLPHTMLHNPLGVGEEFKGSSNWGEYGDAIQEMDHHVGRLKNYLKEEGLDKNTILVYVSDNGRGPGRHAKQPIQGRKLSTYEGGIRVPCIVWGPGVGIQSQESSEITHAMDFYPTLATMAGIKVPSDRILDGRDLAPLWQGKTKTISGLISVASMNDHVQKNRPWNPVGEWKDLVSEQEYKSAFFYHGSQGALAAVRSGDYKLYLNPKLTLFNLAKDPGEQNPLRDKRIRNLRGMAVMFQNEMREYARPAGKNAIIHTPIKQKVSLSKQELASIEAHMGLTYARYGDLELQLDLYKPKVSVNKLPTILCIHGGGWSKGTREAMANSAKKFAANGYVAASLTYRLSDAAKFPANIQDCKAAVRWLRANAETYQIDVNKIAATGSSAGGQLAALLGSSAGVKEFEGEGGNPNYSSAIQAAVPIGAQTDFLSERIIEISETNNEKRFYKRLLGGPYSTHATMYKLASPLTHLDSSDPPMLFMSGEHDDPSTHAEKFRKQMLKFDIPQNYKMILGAPHGFLRHQSWFDASIRETLNFLKVHL
jgi:arylsulfatase A-like enzyme/dienelactone hydrolase